MSEEQIQLNPDDLIDLRCPECDGVFFETLQRIKAISPLKSRSGQLEFLPIPILKCSSCGHIIENAKKVYEDAIAKKVTLT